MNTITIDVKFNDILIKTLSFDADVLLKGIDKPHYTESEQDDIGRVKSISMTDWISLKSFIEEQDIELTDAESGVLSYYIKSGKVSPKQAQVLMILLSKIQNTDFTPTHPFK